MSIEANKTIVRRTFEEIFTQGNLALVDTWIAATFVNHAAPIEMLPGPESLKGHVVLLRMAFPDLHFTVEELIADEERVAARVTFGGTHRGVFQGFPPTARSFVQSQMHMVRFVKGKVVEHWAVRDDLDLMQQLGTVPSEGAASSP
jgi:predicted SnoaL-like aldol condensation-catalyzing enzyme